jgi:thiol-disulfide isomerase/thioredoxin
MYDLNTLRNNSEPVAEYLSTSSRETPAFEENRRAYAPDSDVVTKLKRFVDEVFVIAFSAEWCPDCHRNIPILGLIAEEAGLEINIFGHLMRAPEKPRGNWRIPPSPAEVEEFDVRKIPTIVVLNSDGDKIGEIVEKPPMGVSLERALLDIVESEEH